MRKISSYMRLEALLAVGVGFCLGILVVFVLSMGNQNLDKPPHHALRDCHDVYVEHMHSMERMVNKVLKATTTSQGSQETTQPVATSNGDGSGCDWAAQLRQLNEQDKDDLLGNVLAVQRTKKQTPHNFLMCVHPTDELISRTIREYGYWGAFDIPQTLDTLPPNSLVFDVGSNLGMHGLQALAKGHRVHFFEPVKTTFDRVRCSVAANCWDNVAITHNVGVSDQPGFTTVSVVPQNMGSSTLTGQSASAEGIKVPLVTLDNILKDISEPVQFMKVDVEGFELKVLQGAREAFARKQVKRIFVEINAGMLEKAGTTGEVVIRELMKAGFVLYTGTNKQSRLTEDGVQQYMEDIGLLGDVYGEVLDVK